MSPSAATGLDVAARAARRLWLLERRKDRVYRHRGFVIEPTFEGSYPWKLIAPSGESLVLVRSIFEARCLVNALHRAADV